MKIAHMYMKKFHNYQGSASRSHNITSNLSQQRLKEREREGEIRVGEDVEERKPRMLSVGMQNGATNMENRMEVHQKIKNRTTVSSRNPTSGYLSERIYIGISKRYKHSYGHYSTIHNSQNVETT